jgi:hypothetical protein
MNKNSINARLVDAESRLKKRTRFHVLIIEGGFPDQSALHDPAARDGSGKSMNLTKYLKGE